jgi:hypothetical protein
MDLYYGLAGIPGHTSYHASGARHDRLPTGTAMPMEKALPLREVKGSFNLGTYAFNPGLAEHWRHKYTGDLADAVLFLDLRGMPSDRTVNVMLGLLEPHQLAQVPSRLGAHFMTAQLTVVTSVVPWVWMLVGWMNDADPAMAKEAIPEEGRA